MKRIASFTLLLATLLFSFSAISSEICPDAVRIASKLAQDYRNAVGKVRTACDGATEDCIQRRAQADQIFDQLNTANQAMLADCFFTDPAVDDSLPVTVATVTAAIDLIPVSFLLPCERVGSELAIGCPNGSLINGSKSELMVWTLTGDTPFTYTLFVDITGSVPVEVTGIGSCNIGVTARVQLGGKAAFSTSVEFGTINRLDLTVAGIGSSLTNTPCGAIGDLLSFVLSRVQAQIENYVIGAFHERQFCGATGPELFGPCP